MNENEILEAARAMFGDHQFEVFEEHGQTWLRFDDLEADVSEGLHTFSVVETSNGIDFEEV